MNPFCYVCRFKPDDEEQEDLFVIENKGDDKVYEDKREELQLKALFSPENSKLRQISNSLNLFDKLKSTSKVEPIRTNTLTRITRKNIHTDDGKLVKYWEENKEQIAKGKLCKTKRKQFIKDTTTDLEVYDLWAEKKEVVTSDNNFIVDLKQLPKQVPEHLYQKPSLLPAVEVPLAGQSYNPDKNDHYDLLKSEVDKELEKINKEKYWTKKIEKYYVPVNKVPGEHSWIAEMTREFDESDQDDDVENSELIDEQEIAVYKKSLSKKPKTRQVRRREMEEKLAKKLKEKSKKLKAKESQVFKVKTFNKELAKRESEIVKRAKVRSQRHIESLYKPKRLSRYEFTEPPVEVALTNDLTGSLRSMKVEGNLLVDRFKSLQKRNLIDTRIKQMMPKRKFKIKKEVKKRHKDAVAV